MQILDFVEKAFDIPIRGKATARMRFEEGHFEKKTNLIRLKRWGELEVLAHEIGHSVDKKIAKSTEMWVLKDVPKELRTKVIEERENLDYDQTKKRISEETFKQNGSERGLPKVAGFASSNIASENHETNATPHADEVIYESQASSSRNSIPYFVGFFVLLAVIFALIRS